MKKTVSLYFRQYVTVLFAALLSALSLELLLIPADVVVGGVSGIASFVDIAFSQKSLWFSAGIWIFALNIPVLCYCFAKTPVRFALKTTVYVTALSAFVLLFRATDLAGILGTSADAAGENRVVYTILGGALQGLSLPLTLSVNASTGGTDVVGIAFNRRGKRSSSESIRAILYANVATATLASIAIYFIAGSAKQAVDMFIYSIASLFVGEIVQETVFKGFSAAIELEITTDKPQEMAEALRSNLRHGTTTVRITGGYSGQEKYMVLCVINKRQLTTARRVIAKVDANAFAYVENVKEVIGKGFLNKEVSLEGEESNSGQQQNAASPEQTAAATTLQEQSAADKTEPSAADAATEAEQREAPSDNK